MPPASELPASELPNGTSVRVHAEYLMDTIEAVTRASFDQIRGSRKLRPVVRDALRRELAGAIGKLESLRLWLDAGAPQ